MHVERHTLTIAVDASGDATAYTPVVTGRVLAIHYVKTDYANGVDFVVTAEGSGAAIWTGTNVNASTSVYPRAATHDVTGAAALYAAAGAAVNDLIPVAGEQIKVVVAAGGVSKTGTLHILVG